MLTARTANHILKRLGLQKSKPNSIPQQLLPMIPRLGRTPFNDASWIYEPKLDGFRVIAKINRRTVQLLSRNQYPFTNLFRPITEALTEFPISLILDGEIVVLDHKGRPDFQELQRWLRPRGRTTSSGSLVFYVFDCLYVNGHSLLDRKLELRRSILEMLVEPLENEHVRVTHAFSGTDGKLLYEEMARLGLEGVVAKRRDSPYRPGARSQDWVKIPVRRREEFVVGGFLAEGRHLQALIVGQYNRRGQFAYAGTVGTGMSAHAREDLLKQLLKLRQQQCPFLSIPALRDPFGETPSDVLPDWVRPEVVIDVEFKQHTAEGLRHAVLKGLRPDKSPKEVLAKLMRG